MPPPPLLGYNNNVRHRNRVFHIQTEDSGIASPRIMTHLFADGGRIVKSTRTDYSEFLGREDMPVIVKNMMKEQHKAMFVALRSGELDDSLGFDEESPPPLDAPLPADPPVATKRANELLPALKEVHTLGAAASANRVRFERSSAKNETGAQWTADIPIVELGDSLPVSAQEVLAPSFQADSSAHSSNRPYAPSRPAAIFSVPPPNSSDSIFGNVGLDEESLDDTILSYLAEGPPTKKTRDDD